MQKPNIRYTHKTNNLIGELVVFSEKGKQNQNLWILDIGH